MIPTASVIVDDTSSASSIKSGKSGKSGKAEVQQQQPSSNNSTSKLGGLFKSNSLRSGSISSAVSGGTPGQKGMSAVTEEDTAPQAPQLPPPLDLEIYRQSLQWLQQTCRPVFMKELTQVESITVPITIDNAKNGDMAGGIQYIQAASWKQYRVQVVPADRWGTPQEVLQEIQALHKLRKCRQIIQLYGYLPSSHQPSGQVPALLLQQPALGSLRQFLDHSFDTIQWPEKYKLGLDITQGLRFLISQSMQCSLHSGNILIDGEGVAVLTGFGLPGGLITSAPCQMAAQLSSSSLVLYMSPERIRNPNNYLSEWNVYSLGILLWELSSGRVPFDEIIARAEAGSRLAKNLDQLTSAISKGLREETVPGTPEIYEQLFKMCWGNEPASRPPLDVVEETLQMLVMVEPMDMLMLPGEDIGMSISTVVSDSIDADTISTHTRSNSVRSTSPIPGQPRFGKPQTLHEAVSLSNPDMTEWFLLSGHDINGYAFVPTFSLECEITPVQTCVGHLLPTSIPILQELLDQDAAIGLLAKRSQQNCLHILFDRFIPVRNEHGSAHLYTAVDLLLDAGTEANARDVSGNTPLHILMRNPKISSEDVAEVLNRMVAKGADTSMHAPRDGNVLSLAAKYLHFEAARLILNSDLLASEPESIERAIESCMTMTGRATDKFVNLRTKTRELLKLWTGQAASPRREKVALKLLTEAGLVDSTAARAKGKVIRLAPQAQIDCANRYYDAHIKSKREMVISNMIGIQNFTR
ncbi:hypothetical protein BGW38_004683 [Lunasporangiospora selenospora]|uniref:Protein kinase domain-containing protein n=1 Tax=Lunasporangiospora selenospora TaxID=979761 RepID=A0A9P6FPG8_9FUNG|nr:hypothetical protein BGW38_004683 [Lunasporangiospora selenospora]